MAVEKEIDKVLNKFGNINEHADRIISDLITFIEDINTELQQGEFMFTEQVETCAFIVYNTNSSGWI